MYLWATWELVVLCFGCKTSKQKQPSKTKGNWYYPIQHKLQPNVWVLKLLSQAPEYKLLSSSYCIRGKSHVFPNRAERLPSNSLLLNFQTPFPQCCAPVPSCLLACIFNGPYAWSQIYPGIMDPIHQEVVCTLMSKQGKKKKKKKRDLFKEHSRVFWERNPSTQWPVRTRPPSTSN